MQGGRYWEKIWKNFELPALFLNTLKCLEKDFFSKIYPEIPVTFFGKYLSVHWFWCPFGLKLHLNWLTLLHKCIIHFLHCTHWCFCFQRILPLSISFWHIFLTSEKILGGEEKRVVGGEETFFPIWDFPLFWRGELTFLWSKKMIKVTVKIMLMKSRKSFSLNISSSFSLKFKNVSQLAFTYSNSAIKYQEQSVQYV